MIVLNASALVDWLLQTPRLGSAVAREITSADSLHTLDFASIEVVSALRRKARHGELTDLRAEEALSDLSATRIRRHPADPLTLRTWALRASHSAYDAAYIALAEALDAPLVTTDGRLGRSHGHRAVVRTAGEPISPAGD